jgi:hypothetical protein
MRLLLPLLLASLLVSPTLANADTAVVGGLELGALTSTKQEGRRDLAGLGSFLLGAEWQRGKWNYSVQAGIPLMPGLTAQLPVTARRFFGNYVYLLGSARPLFTLVGQCENRAARCPRKAELDEDARGHGMMIGGFSSFGFGVGDRSRPWSLRFEASYILGYARGIERGVDTETALDGWYQGGAASIGARF